MTETKKGGGEAGAAGARPLPPAPVLRRATARPHLTPCHEDSPRVMPTYRIELRWSRSSCVVLEVNRDLVDTVCLLMPLTSKITLSTSVVDVTGIDILVRGESTLTRANKCHRPMCMRTHCRKKSTSKAWAIGWIVFGSASGERGVSKTGEQQRTSRPIRTVSLGRRMRRLQNSRWWTELPLGSCLVL